VNQHPLPRAILTVPLALGLLAAAASASWAAEPTRIVLPNDLRLIVQPDNSSRIVAVNAIVKFGADRETPLTAGIRYFLQNVMIRGSRDRNATQIAEQLASRGASLNTSLGDDYVEFYATGGVDSWDSLLELVAEILMRPRLDDKEIEAVRTDLLNELQFRQDQPATWSYDLFRGTLFSDLQGTPLGYGLPPGGSEDSLRRITRESLRDCQRQYYVPNNTVVSVVGDVDVNAVRAVAASTFKSFAKRTVPPADLPEVSAEPGRSTVEEREGEMTWLVVGYPAPPVAQADYVPVRVASAVLGEGMASRLFRSLREERKLAYDLANFCPERALASEIATYVAIQPLKDEQGRVADLRLDETKQAVLDEYERLKREPVPEAELDRARNYVAGTFAMAHQKNRQKAWQLGRFESLGVGYAYDRTFPDLVRKVTAADLQRVANTYFVDAVAAVVMPQAMP